MVQRFVAYERVSTTRQGAGGLGPEAQRQVIGAFSTSRGAEVVARFTKVKSGRNPDRPELGKALHLAKITGATVVIAKLDRLSRNAAFAEFNPFYDFRQSVLAIEFAPFLLG